MSAQHTPGRSYGQLVRKAGGAWEGETITFTPDALVRFSCMFSKGHMEVSDGFLDALRIEMGTGVHRDLFNRIARAAIAKATGSAALHSGHETHE